MLVISVTGVTRLHLQTDALGILPDDIPSIRALKDYRDHFSEDQQLILVLDGRGEEIAPEDAADLADYLQENLTGVKVSHQSPFEDDPDLLAASIARLWSYAPTEAIDQLENRLTDNTELRNHLDDVKDQLRHGIDPEQSVIQSYDPLGFLQHPGLVGLLENDASFESDDGELRLLLIDRTTEFKGGYKENGEWIKQIRAAVDAWIEQEEYDIQFSMTGGPVFDAEIGKSMENDMSGTITITAILIGILFLFFQRNPMQLLLIGLTLGLTFLVTLGVGGWLFGTLNLVSVGFAAILLGLVIDYTVVILRESCSGERSSQKIRRTIAPSILLAAMSTSFVFGSLTLSTFSGVNQLGALIAVGLMAGACITLVLAPAFVARFPMRSRASSSWTPFRRPSVAVTIPVILTVLSAIVFFTKGIPSVNFKLAMVEPTTSEAASTFETMRSRFSAWSEDNTLLIASAATLEELQNNSRKSEVILSQKETANEISQVVWPLSLIPDPVAYQANHLRLKKLAQSKKDYLDTAKELGFSDKGLALDASIMEALGDHPEDAGKLAGLVANDPLAGAFYQQGKDSNYLFAGNMKSAQKIDDPAGETWQELSSAGTQVTGWPLLKNILLPRVKKDFFVIFIPCALLLLISLLLVFRSWKDALISITVLLTALFAINGLIVLTNHEWNFLSGMAIPLIVGAGIDYSIHLIFALRRHDDDLAAVWDSVGKAICFCGLSTAIGFGSLLFASTEVLRSMGQLCCAGILLAMILSLLVIPGLWQWCHGRRVTDH